ncbi:hypothetical protein NFI96_016924, partial [Prochilodus magdalenae]
TWSFLPLSSASSCGRWCSVPSAFQLQLFHPLSSFTGTGGPWIGSGGLPDGPMWPQRRTSATVSSLSGDLATVSGTSHLLPRVCLDHWRESRSTLRIWTGQTRALPALMSTSFLIARRFLILNIVHSIRYSLVVVGCLCSVVKLMKCFSCSWWRLSSNTRPSTMAWRVSTGGCSATAVTACSEMSFLPSILDVPMLWPTSSALGHPSERRRRTCTLNQQSHQCRISL